MNFKSLQFVVFLPLVLAAFYAIRPGRRWIVLLAASLYFYAAWKPIYLVLLIGHSSVDYACGLAIDRATRRRAKALLLAVSVVTGIGLIAYFKYLGFFAESLNWALARGGIAPVAVPAILLPVGISFYTFQTMSYTIDVYRGQAPERHYGHFLLFVTYFPQLVAGPIERSSRLLGQLHDTSIWSTERALSGLRLILWGFFKKVVIADQLADAIDLGFGAHDVIEPGTLILVAYAFTFQIYCDFSGYSDIAIGTARLFGHELMVNFDRPWLATSLVEFWRRWHISLSTWFRDYLYFPLGGSRRGPARQAGVTLLVFLVSGLWHGANWTFVVWGALHGVVLAGLALSRGIRGRLAVRLGLGRIPRLCGLIGWLLTFHTVVIGFLVFRAPSLEVAVSYVRRVVDGVAAAGLALDAHLSPYLIGGGLGVAVLIAVELTATHRRCAIEDLAAGLPKGLRLTTYAAIAAFIFVLGTYGHQSFIYFQF